MCKILVILLLSGCSSLNVCAFPHRGSGSGCQATFRLSGEQHTRLHMISKTDTFAYPLRRALVTIALASCCLVLTPGIHPVAAAVPATSTVSRADSGANDAANNKIRSGGASTQQQGTSKVKKQPSCYNWLHYVINVGCGTTTLAGHNPGREPGRKRLRRAGSARRVLPAEHRAGGELQGRQAELRFVL